MTNLYLAENQGSEPLVFINIVYISIYVTFGHTVLLLIKNRTKLVSLSFNATNLLLINNDENSKNRSAASLCNEVTSLQSY